MNAFVRDYELLIISPRMGTDRNVAARAPAGPQPNADQES